MKLVGYINFFVIIVYHYYQYVKCIKASVLTSVEPLEVSAVPCI